MFKVGDRVLIKPMHFVTKHLAHGFPSSMVYNKDSYTGPGIVTSVGNNTIAVKWLGLNTYYFDPKELTYHSEAIEDGSITYG